MNPKKLAALLVVGVILFALAITTSRKNATQPPALVGKEVLPDLDVNAIAGISVTTSNASVSVQRTDDGWTCPASYGYPADFEKIRDCVLKLDSLTVGQVIDINTAQLADLDLDPGNPAATHVELKDVDGNQLASLRLGAERTREAASTRSPYGGAIPDGRFLTVDDGETVFLVADRLADFDTDHAAWLNAELVDVAAADIETVEIAPDEGKPIRLTKPEGAASLELDGLADNEELDASKLYGIEAALSRLRLDDIADPSLPDAELGFDAPSQFHAATANGIEITVLLGKDLPDGGRYIRLEAALSEEAAPEGAPTEEDSADADSAAGDAVAQVDAINARVEGWTYVIASYKADAMTRSREDIVKEKEEEESETGNSDADDAS